MGLRRSIHPMVQRKQNKMTPDELKQAADELVEMFGPYMAIEHCKLVIEVLEGSTPGTYTNYLFKKHRLILS